MAPTLKDSERILVDKAVKWTGGFHRGDIIVIHDKKRPLICQTYNRFAW